MKFKLPNIFLFVFVRLKNYKFTCDCVACINEHDYPKLLVELDSTPTDLTITSLEWRQLSDQKKAWKKFNKCKKYLEKNDSSYPSFGLHKVYVAMRQEFFTLCKNFTLNASSK
jgi:hypothetical protein